MLKKILAYIIAAVAVSGIIIIIVTSKDKNAGAQSDVSGITSDASGSPLYVLKEYQGHVGVFRYGYTSPSEILDALISDLPAHDREELKSGVYVYSDDELQQRIEDYDS